MEAAEAERQSPTCKAALGACQTAFTHNKDSCELSQPSQEKKLSLQSLLLPPIPDLGHIFLPLLPPRVPPGLSFPTPSLSAQLPSNRYLFTAGTMDQGLNNWPRSKHP